MIEADTVRLERCLRNLLENALKYSNDDVRITVTLTMEKQPLPNSHKRHRLGNPQESPEKTRTTILPGETSRQASATGIWIRFE